MKRHFKHQLPVQKIVVRQDAETQSDYLETNVGQLFPLIRIKEQVLEFADIIAFNLSVGSTFLPVVNFTFEDYDSIFRESNFIEKEDIITVYVGNAKDEQHEVIKNNYLVMNVVSNPNSSAVSIEAILDVPKIYDSVNRHFNKTSFEILKELAAECQLGFVSNIETTNDQMNWIQYNSNLDFIQYLQKNSRINLSTRMEVFVDQFANLNVIDLLAAIQESATTEITTEPITGLPLEQPVKLIASNYAEGNDFTKAIITSWSPISNYGEVSRIWPTTLRTLNFDISDNQSVKQNNLPQIHKQLRGGSTWSHFETDNAYSTYASSKVINVNNMQLVQGIRVNVELDYFIPVIYLMMTLPLEIWNLIKKTEKWSQDESVDNESLENVEPIQESNKYKLNERMSGDTLLQNMTISYIRKGVNQEKRLIQSFQVFLKNQE